MRESNSNTEKIVFFSVLFNPNENALNNIKNASESGYSSVVYVNRVDQTFLRELDLLNVVLLGRNENVGLGVAFSELEDYLSKCGVEYFLYFDQDTLVTSQTWKRILRSYKDCFSSANIGMLFFGANKSSYSDVVLNSGCLFSMDVIRKVGNHNSTFFVEGVDYEFCLRLKKYHYKIQNIYFDSIDHLSLQDGDVVNVFGLKLNARIYGNKRLKDFNKSHIRLLGISFASRQWRMGLFFVKSMLAFNMGEFKSRIFSRFF